MQRVAEIKRCPKHREVLYGFDILGPMDPIQERRICPHCGNTGLDLGSMGLAPLGVLEAVTVRCADGN